MSTREEFPSESPGDIRPDSLSPEQLKAYLPGAPLAYLPGSGPFHVDDIEPDIANAEQVWNETADKMHGEAIALALPVINVADEITGRMFGDAANDVEYVEGIWHRVQQKLTNGAENALRDVYGKMNEVGLPTPDMDAVQYGNTTGDYLGSLLGGSGDKSMPSDTQPPEIVQPISQQPDNRPTPPVVQPPVNPPVPINPPGTNPPPIPPGPTGIPPQPPGPGPGGPPLPPNCGEVIFSNRPRACTGQWVILWEQVRCKWVDGIRCCTPLIYGGQDMSDPNGFLGGYRLVSVSTDWTRGLEGTGQGSDKNRICFIIQPNSFLSVDPEAEEIWAVECNPTGWIVPVEQRDATPEDCGKTDDGTIPPTEPPGTIPPTSETGSCPAPAPTCTPAKDFQAPILEGASDKTCKMFEDSINKLLPSGSTIGDWVSAKAANVSESTWGKIISLALGGQGMDVVPALINRFGKWMKEVSEKSAKGAPCDDPRIFPISTYQGILRFLDQWLGLIPPALKETVQQMANMVCQYIMPAQQSCDAAFLAGEIDREVWECWTKLNGNIVEAAEKGLDTLRTRPTADQLGRLFRRDQLKEDDYKKRMRERGVIREEDREAIFNLSQEWPTVSELIPLMVRDVFDNTTVDWTKADEIFKDKFDEEAEKYAKANGVTKELMLLFWRAHFHLPSMTMGNEMYHRFRNLDKNNPLYTGKETLQQLYIQDDWSPQWIDRMIELSHTNLRLVDIRRAHEIRTLGDDELKKQLQYRGYNDANIKIMFDYWDKQREIRDAKMAGFPTVKQAVAAYANCEIAPNTFLDLIKKVAETDQQQALAKDAAILTRKINDNRRAISGITYQYKRGLITEAEATDALSKAGIDPECIPHLIEQIKQKTAKQPKQLSASKLCQLREYGIISTDEMMNGLIRTGWSSTDAYRITQECTARLTDKAMRKANAEAQRIAREAKAAEREEKRRQRILECGEPPCPKNSRIPSLNGADGPKNPSQN